MHGSLALIIVPRFLRQASEDPLRISARDKSVYGPCRVPKASYFSPGLAFCFRILFRSVPRVHVHVECRNIGLNTEVRSEEFVTGGCPRRLREFRRNRPRRRAPRSTDDRHGGELIFIARRNDHFLWTKPRESAAYRCYLHRNSARQRAQYPATVLSSRIPKSANFRKSTGESS